MAHVPGIDRLAAEPERWLAGERVALLTNQAALTARRVPSADALRAAVGGRLVALLSPEHGWSGLEEDATAVPDRWDARTGLRLVSLYGPRRRPERALLRSIDAVVVDLPDVGVRCYTYATSAALLLEAARDEDVQVIVCDRPAVLGPRIDGPALGAAARSFLGYLDVPFQHGVTLGELLRFHAGRLGGAPLSVVPVAGWRREALGAWDGAGFVPPSPGLPSPAAVALYPGLVALEGTELSEGRGTPLPFQLVGGPGVDGHALAGALAEAAPPGVWARPLAFRPASGPLAGVVCGGVQLHVSDAGALRALALGARILRLLHAQGKVVWRPCAAMPWARGRGVGGRGVGGRGVGGRGVGGRGGREPWLEPVDGLLVDALLGDASFRAVVEGRSTLQEAEAGWSAAHRAFLDAIEPQLLYPGAPVSAAEEGSAAGAGTHLWGGAPRARTGAGGGGRGPRDRPTAAHEPASPPPPIAERAALGLGIDAGGSSTRWRLEAATGDGAGGRLPPLAGHLYDAAGRDGAAVLLDDLVDAVRAALERTEPGGAVAAAVAGVTGVAREGDAATWLRRALAERLGLTVAAVTVLDDIELAFQTAFPQREGVLVHAGTGAIAVCDAPSGGRLRAGGHGYLVDDDGGGFSIGRAALRAVLRAADEAGEAPRTVLSDRVHAVAGGSWEDVRAYVYGGGRAAVAALVPAVAAAAEGDDPGARRILAWAGGELARLANVLLARVTTPRPVALGGGLARLGGELERHFREALPRDAEVRIVTEEPVRAAARLALRAAADGRAGRVG